MKAIKKDLLLLIESSQILGLSEVDLNHARDFLEYNEYELCFDTIITQMYEFDIRINEPFFHLVEKVGGTMKLPVNTYSFINELIRKK